MWIGRNSAPQDIEESELSCVDCSSVKDSVNNFKGLRGILELVSEKYNAASSNFNVDAQTLILETHIEDFEVFEAKINLVLGQQKFPFTITIDPSNPGEFTDILDLPLKPISVTPNFETKINFVPEKMNK